MPLASPFTDFHCGPVSRLQPLFHFSLVLFSLRLCTMLDHFGYPAALFSVWRQARWYNLHLTEVWLCEIRQNIIDGHEPLPTIGAMLADLPPPGGERPRVLTCNCSSQCSHLLFQPGACCLAHSGPEGTMKPRIAQASGRLDRQYWHWPQTHSAGFSQFCCSPSWETR